MFIIGLILFILSIIIYIFCAKQFFHYKEYNDVMAEKNVELLVQKNDLIKEQSILEKNCSDLRIEYDNLLIQERQESEKIIQLQSISDGLINSAQASFEKYCNILEDNYNKTEKEYEIAENKLKEAYNILQLELLNQMNRTKEDLEKIQATRAAAIEAKRKEKKIQEQLDYYCLRIPEDELTDIRLLDKIKSKLHQPRILCMLIWSSYFQKPMTTLCNNILGIKEVCGIYKITNQINEMCYIGQSVDIAKRWKDHAKCGLGIDAPANNKLYRAMQEEGLENFSWELLEQCKKEELNEKEKFYISLYQSDKYGYNSNKRCWLKHRLLFFIKKYNIIYIE